MMMIMMMMMEGAKGMEQASRPTRLVDKTNISPPTQLPLIPLTPAAPTLCALPPAETGW
eukprot:SAG22_NODE_1015_length_6025_cov_3.431320_5_plen_59_part_00